MARLLLMLLAGAIAGLASAKDRVMFLSAHPDDIISSLATKMPSWGR